MHSGLYNAETVINEQSMYLVQNIEDAQALKKYGKAVVAPPDGRNDDWQDSYTEFLRGRDVAIIANNDNSGYTFSGCVSNLIGKAAKSTRILCLKVLWPEMPDGGNAVTFFNKFGKDGVKMLSEFARDTEPCYETNEQPHAPDFYSESRFLHNVMGDYLVRKYGVCKINDTIHIYDNGLYKQGEEALHGFMIDLIPTLTDAKRKEVYKYIKASRKTPVKEVSPPHLLPFASRIYDIRENKFIEYAPEHVFLNRFPFDYNPDAPECDTVTQTINRIAEGDAEVVNLLYEAMGNCFYMLNSFRGAVMLYGKSGNNGKSTLLNMIATMIGRENTSYLTLQDTAEKFRLTEVYGKAANIGDDIPSSYLPESSTFKKLVTGERITAEKKGQDPFSFKPYAKMFFAMNGLPPVSDKSKAFFGRILLIPLNNDFSKSSEMDVNLKDKQWTKREMECLTKHAVEGLKRLLQNGDFTRPQCVLDAVAEYEAENNPVKEFLEEYGSVTNQTTQFVYDRFTEWCYRNGHRNIMTRKKFTREACELTGLKSRSIRIDDKTPKAFVSE